MGERTKIEWTDHTFNPWRGCAHAQLLDGSTHPGCDHCYAEALAKRNPAVLGQWGEGGRRVIAAPGYLKLPQKWNAAAEKAGERRRVFCASLADVFEDFAGKMHYPDGERSGLSLDFMRGWLFAVIDATPWLDWLLLTKRPQNILRFWPDNRHRENVWLLTSVSDQATFDELHGALIQCDHLASVLGLSVEPLLGPIDLGRTIGIDWVIVGGESGPGARPMHPDWVRDLRDQCQAADVPFFFKQWGEWKPIREFADGELDRVARYPEPSARDPEPNAVFPWPSFTFWYDGRFQMHTMFRTGKKAAGRLLDGAERNEFPQIAPITQRGAQ